MAVSSLPQEIFNAIIDFLSDDVISLRSCALASSVLRPRSQQYLFKTIYLDKEGFISALDAVFTHSPHLSCHTEHLQLRIPGSISIWASPGIKRILGALKRIEDMGISFPDRLVYGRRAPDTVGPAAVVQGNFIHLKNLRLDACAFQTRAAHDSLLQSLPNLRSFSIGKGVRCWECLHYRSQHILPGSDGNVDQQHPLLKEVTFDCASDNGRCVLQSIKSRQIQLLRILGAGTSGVEANLLNCAIETFKSVEEVHVDLRCPPTTITASEPSNAKRPRWTSATDTALADRLDAIVDSSHNTTISNIVLMLDDRACRGADWAEFGSALSSTSVKHLQLHMASDVELDHRRLILKQIRAGFHDSAIVVQLYNGLAT